MNDKDFDKLFGDKLREERHFSSHDGDWEQLSTRLDSIVKKKETEKRRRNAAWLWLLLLPILSFLLWEMNDIKNQNKELTEQLSAIKAQLKPSFVIHDTVVRLLQKTDTIIVYKNKSSNQSNKKGNDEKRFTKLSPSVNQNLSLQNSSFQSKNDFPLANQLSVIQKDTSAPKSQNEDKKIGELTEKIAELNKQLDDFKNILADVKTNATAAADCRTQQDLLKKQLNQALFITDSLKNTPLSRETQKTDKSLKNNRLFIGIQGGRINYRTTWTNSVGVEIYKDIKSYQAGVKFEYALTEKFRVIAEGDICPFSFTNYWQDRRYNLPDLQFDPQKEKFLKAETSQKLLQGNIGIKYLFTEGSSKWRPSVSLAYTMMRINPFSTKYTYQPIWGQYNREQIVQSAAVNVPNLLILAGGLEYRFSKYAVVQAEAFYYKDVNKIHKTFDLFGLRGAVLVNLK